MGGGGVRWAKCAGGGGLAEELPEGRGGQAHPRERQAPRATATLVRSWWLAALGYAVAHSGLSRAGPVARGGTKAPSACGSSVPEPQRPARSSRDSAAISDMLASCATRWLAASRLERAAEHVTAARRLPTRLALVAVSWLDRDAEHVRAAEEGAAPFLFFTWSASRDSECGVRRRWRRAFSSATARADCAYRRSRWKTRRALGDDLSARSGRGSREAFRPRAGEPWRVGRSPARESPE